MNDSVPARAPGPHPTPEQLYAAHHGPRTPEAEQHLAHAAACALCSEELLRQEAFDDPEPMAQPDLEAAWKRFGEPPQTRRPPRRSPYLALAAVLALAVLGLGLWRAVHTTGPAGGDVTRSGGPVAGTRSPEGDLAAPPAEFVFPSSPSGEPRRVTVFDTAQTYTWTSPPTSSGRISFPDSERWRLQSGVEYYWTVVGEEDIPARSFRIRP